MNIDLLSKMVKELILESDEVVLPGVGTFVAELESASFSDRGYTINPPYRRLSFRQSFGDEVGEDSLLFDFYASTNGIPREKAASIITSFLLEMKELLKSRKIIVFPGLGRLRATKENNFFFICDEDIDIYPQGFGLEPISLKTHSETPEEVSDAIRKLEDIFAPQAPATEDPEATAKAPAIEAGNDSPAEKPAEEPVMEMSAETPTETSEEEPVFEVEPIETEITSEDAGTSSPCKDVEVSEAADGSDRAETSAAGKNRRVWKTMLWVLLVLIILVAAYAILARIFPDFFDTLLYSKEELQILYYR